MSVGVTFPSARTNPNGRATYLGNIWAGMHWPVRCSFSLITIGSDPIPDSLHEHPNVDLYA